jgi:hypothetical protein
VTQARVPWGEIGMEGGGWHLSYFLSSKDIARKIESFPHREFDHEQFKVGDHVKRCVQTGADILMRDDFKLGRVSHATSSHMLPEGWQRLQDRLMKIQQQEE